jgi:hypothetical protein
MQHGFSTARADALLPDGVAHVDIVFIGGGTGCGTSAGTNGRTGDRITANYRAAHRANGRAYACATQGAVILALTAGGQQASYKHHHYGGFPKKHFSLLFYLLLRGCVLNILAGFFHRISQLFHRAAVWVELLRCITKTFGYFTGGIFHFLARAGLILHFHAKYKSGNYRHNHRYPIYCFHFISSFSELIRHAMPIPSIGKSHQGNHHQSAAVAEYSDSDQKSESR